MPSSHVKHVVLDQLPQPDKDKFYDFLLYGNAHFGFDKSTGLYRADITIVDSISNQNTHAASCSSFRPPNIQVGSVRDDSSVVARRTKVSEQESSNGDGIEKLHKKVLGRWSRAARMGENRDRHQFVMKKAAMGSRSSTPLRPKVPATWISECDLSSYERLLSQLSVRNFAQPKIRPVGQLIQWYDEIFDIRYRRDSEMIKLEEEHGEEVAEHRHRKLKRFPDFLYECFCKKYGLRCIVDQSLWDLVYSTQVCRDQYPQCDMFAKFLEESYDTNDLLFFLYVRSLSEIEYQRRQMKQYGGSRLSYRNIQVILRQVYVAGTDSPQSGQECIQQVSEILEPLMGVNQEKPSEMPSIDTQEFFKQIVWHYHSNRADFLEAQFLEQGGNAEQSQQPQAHQYPKDSTDKRYTKATPSLSSASQDVDDYEISRTHTAAGQQFSSVSEEMGNKMTKIRSAARELERAVGADTAAHGELTDQIYECGKLAGDGTRDEEKSFSEAKIIAEETADAVHGSTKASTSNEDGHQDTTNR
jgi:hypothetical protein